MFKELFDSSKHVLHERITNPFAGSFVLAWLTLNWELFYSLFTFDKETTLDSKVSFIKGYISSHWLGDMFLLPIGYAILIIIAYVILSNFVRIITSLSIKVIRPAIDKYFDGFSNLVSREVYNDLRDRYDALNERYNKGRQELTLKFSGNSPLTPT